MKHWPGISTILLAAAFLLLGPFVRGATTLYVSSGDHTIDQIDSTGVVSAFATLPAGSNPYGLAFDTGGNLYAAISTTNQISKITPDGTVSLFATLPSGSTPVGLAFDTSGKLYATDFGTSSISKITTGGVVSNLLINGGTPFFPLGLAFDSSGNLYVSFSGPPSYVATITADGRLRAFAIMSDGGAGAVGLAFDTSGNLYVANDFVDQISKVTPGGVVSTFATLPTGSKPLGLAFDDIGNLYAADNGTDQISMISPDGLTVTSFASVPSPTFIAIAVPEPTRPLLLVMGAASLLLRRLRNVK